MTRDLNKSHTKTRDGKRNRVKKRNVYIIDKLDNINLLDAITQVKIGNAIKCVLYILYIIRPVFYSVFCSVPCFSKHPEVCVDTQNCSPVFLPFRRLFDENNYCNLLRS
jgi:hypothetical protein